MGRQLFDLIQQDPARYTNFTISGDKVWMKLPESWQDIDTYASELSPSEVECVIGGNISDRRQCEDAREFLKPSESGNAVVLVDRICKAVKDGWYAREADEVTFELGALLLEVKKSLTEESGSHPCYVSVDLRVWTTTVDAEQRAPTSSRRSGT